MEKNGEITDQTPDEEPRSEEKTASADDKNHASTRAAEAVTETSKKNVNQ